MQRNTFSHKAKADSIVTSFSIQQQKNIRMIKKYNEIGDFYQIIAQFHIGYDNAFLKIKLETTTKPKAKVHCKARVNDNYLECIQKMYNEGKIIHPEYKIDTERFNDDNRQCHLNITFLSKPEEKMHITLQNLIYFFDKISSSINNTYENDENIDDNSSNINGITERIIATAPIEKPIKTPNEKLIETPIEKPIETPIASPIETPVEKLIETPIANIDTAVSNTVSENIVSDGNTNASINTFNVQPPTETQSILQSLGQFKEHITTTIDVPVSHIFPQHKIPLFYELTVESLDNERAYIYNFEAHISKLQKDLEIMKKQHGIRISCYNEIIDLHISNLESQTNENKMSPLITLEVISKKVDTEKEGNIEAKTEAKAEVNADVKQMDSTVSNIETTKTDTKSPIEGNVWSENCTEEEEWNTK